LQLNWTPQQLKKLIWVFECLETRIKDFWILSSDHSAELTELIRTTKEEIKKEGDLRDYLIELKGKNCFQDWRMPKETGLQNLLGKLIKLEELQKSREREVNNNDE